MKSIISKSLFAFAGLALCASCASHTLTTTVKMGYANGELGQWWYYNSKQYTVVQYYFSGVDEECPIKSSNFSVLSNGNTYKGESFVTSRTGTQINSIASDIKLTNYVYVMYNEDLSYSDKNAVGTINNTSGIKINTVTSITFKW